jgi:Ca2+-binding EF-hand superfamily protein
MKTVLTLTAAALAAVAITVGAAEGGPRGERGDLFKKADTNGDGKISKDEAKANAPRLFEHFDAIDTNKDGQITADEMRAFHEKRRAEHWKKLDTNGDGFISKDEAKAAPRLYEHFDQLDTNKDGKLSKEEMQAARGHGRK